MRQVSMGSLGKCPSCRVILVLSDQDDFHTMHCTSCLAPITMTAFGFEVSNTEIGKKVCWLDELGEWTSRRPEIDFTLGNMRVYARCPMLLRTFASAAKPQPAYAAA